MKKEYLTVAFSIILLFFISSSVHAGFEIDAGTSYSTLNMKEFNDFLAMRSNENDDTMKTPLKRVFNNIEGKQFSALDNASGAIFSGRYWFNDLIAIGGALEASLISSPEYSLDLDGYNLYNEKFKLNLYGALSEVKAKVLEEEERTVILNINFGKYYSFLEWDKRYDRHAFDLEEDRKENFVYNAEGWGAKFGSQFSYQITDTVNLDSTLNYRLLVIDDYKDDEGKKFFDSYNNQVMEFDFSGFELISSVSFRF